MPGLPTFRWRLPDRFVPALVLAGMALVLAVLRLHTFHEPLERDITTYAVIGHELRNGRALYSDLWDHKPPAIHVTFAAAEAISSYGPASIYLLNVVVGTGILVGCYLAGSAGRGGRLGGFTAAGLWTIAGGSLALEGNQPNTELFINCCLVFAFALLARSRDTTLTTRGMLLLGGLLALGTLYKHVVVIVAAALMLVWILTRTRGARWTGLRQAVLIAAVGFFAWGGVLIWFGVTGRMQTFIDAVFTYNQAYAGDLLSNLRAGFYPPRPMPGVAMVLIPLALITAAGLIRGLASDERRLWLLLLAAAAAVHVVVALPGRFFPHYYQLWLPVVVIGSAWTLARLPRPERAPVLPVLASSLLVVGMIALEAPAYGLSPEEWSIRKYGRIFVAARDLARKIDRVLPPDATLYEWGSETGFYFETGRRSPTGVTFRYPLLTGPLAASLSKRVMQDLQRDPPALIVIALEGGAVAQHPFVDWCQANYRLVERTPDNLFLVLVRRGGPLDSNRLTQG